MTSTVTAVNQTQSLAAIRNFVRAAVSFITYARGLCNDNAYEQRPFLGLPLRQLIPSTTESVTISEWIEKGAFDALNRNYLKEMSLCVYDEACETLLESYCFGFNYSTDGQRAQMSLSTSQNAEGHTRNSQISGGGVGGIDGSTAAAAAAAGPTVPAYRRRRCSKQEVQRMLTQILERLLEVVGCLPPLLSKRVLTMRLTYYDAVTPNTYEPPCFAPASRRMLRQYEEEVKLHVHIGSMDTSHHFFSVAVRHPLLQQVQTQMMAQTAAGNAEQGATGESAPLRSGLESTFSSDPVPPSTAARVEGTEGKQCDGTTPKLPCSVDSAVMEKGKNDCWLEEAENEEAGGGDAVTATVEAAATCTDTAKDGGNGVGSVDSVRCLVEDATATSPSLLRRSLKPRELVFLLLASFAFCHAPSVRGGRGRISSSDVEAYRAQSCPLDLSAETAQQMMQQLSNEGYLTPCGDVKDGPQKKSSQLRRLPPVKDLRPTSEWWTVPDPPLPLLQRLLQVTDLTHLLTHPCHVALQELCVYLERERTRTTDCTALREEPARTKRKRGRERT